MKPAYRRCLHTFVLPGRDRSADAQPLAPFTGIITHGLTLPGRRRPSGHGRHRSAGRADAAAHIRRVRRPGRAARSRQAAAGGDRAGSAAIDHPVGTAGHRQDDAGADHRRHDEGAVRLVQRRAGRHQGDPRRDGGSRAAAPFDRTPDHRVHRRDSPVQQGTAGRVPAARRGGRHRARRRDDREPIVRSQRRIVVAIEGIRAAGG